MTLLRRLSAVLVLVAPLVAAGCSSDVNSSAQFFGDLARNAVPRGTADAPNPARTLTRADLAGVTLPLLRVSQPEQDAVATLALAAVNQGVETWVTGNGIAILLDGPILFGTRGIGPDLISAETAEVRAAVQAGRGASYTRTLRRLDGENRLPPVAFRCTLTPGTAETIVVLERRHATRRAVESCAAEDGTGFENVYWFGDGTLWKSRQWVGSQAGYILTERLVR